MTEFKKLRGNRVFLEVPSREDSGIIVDHNTKVALEEAIAKKNMKLKIYAAGDLVTDLKKGDQVLVDPEALVRAKIVPISATKSVLLVSNHDIALIW